MYHLRETSCSVRKRSDATDWSQLNEMNICDLDLYSANRGRFIQGKIIVQPCAPIVGIIFILEDSRGDVLPVALYLPFRWTSWKRFKCSFVDYVSKRMYYSYS